MPTATTPAPRGCFTACHPCPPSAAEPGAHVLIVGRSCPWAHRAWLVWSLRQLHGDSIELLVVEPDPKAGRWRFQRPFLGCNTLQELYRRSGAAAQQRATVPVLVHRPRGAGGGGRERPADRTAQPVARARWDLDLAPPSSRRPSQHWRELLQDAVNDGVYRCGFARNQEAYDRAETALFAALDQAEAALQSAGHSPGSRAPSRAWPMCSCSPP